jgi:hypothetical protein
MLADEDLEKNLEWAYGNLGGGARATAAAVCGSSQHP